MQKADVFVVVLVCLEYVRCSGWVLVVLLGAVELVVLVVLVVLAVVEVFVAGVGENGGEQTPQTHCEKPHEQH